MTDETPTKPWIQRRATHIGIALLLLLLWSLAANQWADKGCQAFPKSYGLVISHFGPPDHFEGCDEYGGYTDNYYDR